MPDGKVETAPQRDPTTPRAETLRHGDSAECACAYEGMPGRRCDGQPRQPFRC